jgi:hypothetical protein
MFWTEEKKNRREKQALDGLCARVPRDVVLRATAPPSSIFSKSGKPDPFLTTLASSYWPLSGKWCRFYSKSIPL